jgi:16S rRNA (cytosine967-C5)-methyltransferase
VALSRRQAAVRVTAREAAARVVQRVLTEDVFLSDALHTELSKQAFEPRDRALMTELAYGVVRLHPFLAERLGQLAPRGLATGDVLGQAHLWVAAYQLCMLERVPAFAAIDQVVGTLKRLRGERFAGFANAVLRRFSELPRPERASAVRASTPSWLYEALVHSVGEREAGALLGVEPGSSTADGEVLPHRGLCVRLRPNKTRNHAWVSDSVPGSICEHARWLPPRGDLRHLSGYTQGDFVVQEEGSQWAALALGARPGEVVYDACAGHGQKALVIAEQLAGTGRLWASDRSAGKIARLKDEFRRLGMPEPETRVIDLSEGTGDVPANVDRVIVDAPCSGSGTLRRRPEIMFRLVPEDPARLAALSQSLLRNAASRVRPGGRVLFVVCSVLEVETSAVRDALADLLLPAPFDSVAAQRVAGREATEYRLLPGAHGTDGYYVASFVRRA